MRSANLVPTIFSPFSVPTKSLATATPLATTTAAIRASNSSSAFLLTLLSSSLWPGLICSAAIAVHYWLLASITFVVLYPRATCLLLLQRLCLWGLTVDLSTALVSAIIQLQRLIARLDQLQGLLLYLIGTPPAYLNKTHLGCIVLEVEDARHTLLELLNHQHVLVALEGNTGLLALLVDPSAVYELDRRRSEPFRVVWRANLWICQHGYPRMGTFLAADPGGGIDELAVLVLLGVLTQQPHIPCFVLRKKG